MESELDSYRSQEGNKLVISKGAIQIALGLLALLWFLLFRTISTDLTCVRSLSGLVECSLVRTIPLVQLGAVEILQRVAVDVVEHHGNKIPHSYRTCLQFNKESSLLRQWHTPPT